MLSQISMHRSCATPPNGNLTPAAGWPGRFTPEWKDWTNNVKSELEGVVRAISDPSQYVCSRRRISPTTRRQGFSGLDVEIIKAPVHDICIRDIAPTFLRSKDGGLQGYDPGTWIGDSYGAQGCVAGVGVQRLEGL